MKLFKVKYQGSGIYSYIKATTEVTANDEMEVKVYMKKFYPSAVVTLIQEVKK